MNFARMFKASLMRKAFSKWRLTSYNYVVEDMN